MSEIVDNNNDINKNAINNEGIDQNVNVVKDDAGSDISPSSGVSSASSKSEVSKQSGIKPPSRIGRPCGGIQKPAVPTTPTKNYSDDSIRRITDEFGRHKLSDLLEMDESKEDFSDSLHYTAPRKRYTSIGSTASSMEGLWELHPRRLSEAGLSRHSDSSAVLTEDTDSFMIGQRVWVGGTKPGTIAFIGETQFAPGEWAGIALDDPIGKNDGSVGGIRYFQCENKKGVFSRLTRLTRVPLEQPGMGSNETFISPNNGVRKSPISPTGSTRSLLKSPASLSNSVTSLASNATHIDFKIGDRVIIKSTQGSKVGTVRYMGLTDFAPGEWVGVELDDPRGKNDGSVEGKRYFECRPNFGLFAPISKVSKSPSKYKPSACVVHSGSGLPPSGMKRANSKESMTSLTSAASSVRRVRLGVTSLTPKKTPAKTSTPLPTRTALQDVLREKQQHIEQLLKERDLERAEITKAAGQAEDAEQRFLNLKHEFEKHLLECEARIKENSTSLNQLNIERDDFLSQLEDEKRKNEDLQFRYEEASITKGDVEVANENYLKKITELEAQLGDERQKTETIESTTNRLFETEENLIKAREEIETLKNQLAESDRKLEPGIRLVKLLQDEIDLLKLQNRDKVNELELKTSKDCREKDEEILKLMAQIEDQKRIIEMNKTELGKENEKLKMEISSRTVDLESSNDQLGKKDNEIVSLMKTLEEVKTNEEQLKKELEETRESLKTKSMELEDVKKDCGVNVAEKQQEVQNANEKISEHLKELEKRSIELNEMKTTFEDHKAEIHSRHARQVANQDTQIMALSVELQTRNEEITKSSIVISKLEEDICTKNSIIAKLQLEIESFETRLTNHSETSTSLNAKLNELILSNGALQRQVISANEQIAELLTIREKLQIEINSLTEKCDNAEELSKLRTEIELRESRINSLKIEFEQKMQGLEGRNQELELALQTNGANNENVLRELEAKLTLSLKTEDLLKQQCEHSLGEVAKVRDELGAQVTELQKLLQEKEFAFTGLENEASEKVRIYQQEIAVLTEKLNKIVYEIQILTQENVSMKEKLAEKNEEVILAQAAISQANAHCEGNEKQFTESLNKVQFDLNEKNLQVEKLLIEIDLLKKDCHLTNTDVTLKDEKISELTVELQRAQEIIKNMQEQINLFEITKRDKLQEMESSQNQCQDLMSQIVTLTSQLQNSEQIYNNLQNEHRNALLLINQLSITEKQKNNCLEVLQQNNGDNCTEVVELLNQVRIDQDENLEKMRGMQNENDYLKKQLLQITSEFQKQQNDVLLLQNELIKSREEKPTSTDPDSVRFRNPTLNTRTVLDTNPETMQAQYTLEQILAQSENLLLQLLEYLKLDEKAAHVIQKLLMNVEQIKYLNQIIQSEFFKLFKQVHDLVLLLQDKEQSENYLINTNNHLQEMIANLPVQCKSYAVLNNLNRCAGFEDEREKYIKLLNAKDEYIAQLKSMISQIEVRGNTLPGELIELFSSRCTPFEISVLKENYPELFERLEKPGTAHLPKLPNVRNCVSPSEIVENISLDEFPRLESTLFKNSLFELLHAQEVCGTRTVEAPEMSCKCSLPDLAMLENCITPQEIDYLTLPNECGIDDVITFKDSLRRILIKQKECSFRNEPVGSNVEPDVQPENSSPHTIIKEVLVEVPGKCKLPELNPNGGLEQIEVLDLTSYDLDDGNRFKQNLYGLIMNQCMPSTIDKDPLKKLAYPDLISSSDKLKKCLLQNEDCECHLPDLNILGCENLHEQIRGLQIPNVNPLEINNYKEDLLVTLLKQRQCVPEKEQIECHLPSLNASDDFEREIESLQLPGFHPDEVSNFKMGLILLFRNNLQNQLPDLSLLRGCVTQAQIDSLIPNNPATDEVISFKTTLYKILIRQRYCPTYPSNKNMLLEVEVNNPKQPLNKGLDPDNYNDPDFRSVDDPNRGQDNKPQYIYVPKIVIKEVPGPTQIVIKEVPQPPRIIYKENPDFMKDPNSFDEPSVQENCHLPVLNIFGCDDLVGRIQALNLEGYNRDEVVLFKENLLSMLASQRDCISESFNPGSCTPKVIVKELPPRILIKQVPGPNSMCNLPILNENEGLDQIQNLDLSNYDLVESTRFKESLYGLIMNQRQFATCLLPKIQIESCNLAESINRLEIVGYPQIEVDKFKENLFYSFNNVKKCFTEDPTLLVPPQCNLPILNIYECDNLREQVDSLKLEYFPDGAQFKNNLLSTLIAQRNCVKTCHLPNLQISGCQTLENQIQSLNLDDYQQTEIIPFKENLYSIILDQQKCCSHSMIDLPQTEKLTLGLEKLAYLRHNQTCTLHKQLAFYKSISERLLQRLQQLHDANAQIVLNDERPAVPIPIMHVLKSLTPYNPFQQTSVGVENVIFLRNLHQQNRNTQLALSHCMDAILAQTVIHSQIKNQCNNVHQLIQDKELAENQIKFLNSIIVDIQQKNEEQKARIEILEAGCSPAMADELKLMGTVGVRQVPPRLYCDICEEFDLHETEDCPQQDTDLPMKSEKHVMERPYCEICEAFGHKTEECQEDQTF